jgi:hypothetical protein
MYVVERIISMAQPKMNLTVQVSPEWYEYLKRCAEGEGRGLSAYVRRVLEAYHSERATQERMIRAVMTPPNV